MACKYTDKLTLFQCRSFCSTILQEKEHTFLTIFLAAWGAALERRGARRRK
jgi:hypothetical protein